MTRIPINDEDDREENSREQGDGRREYRDGSAPTESVSRANPELEALKAERDSLFDRLARATADFKNSQRRMQQDLDSRLQYANSSLLKSVLPVIDNFERAL